MSKQKIILLIEAVCNWARKILPYASILFVVFITLTMVHDDWDLLYWYAAFYLFIWLILPTLAFILLFQLYQLSNNEN